MEQFTDDWEKRWTPSHAKKEDSTSDEDWAYVGEWSVEEPTVFKGIEGDKGLVLKNPAAHHAISAKFPKKIDNKGKTLVVQYEVKPQSELLRRNHNVPILTAISRLPCLWWRLLEASPREQEAPPRGILQRFSLRDHVWSRQVR